MTAPASAARQFLHTAGTRIALIVLGGITSIVIAHSLGPEGRGGYYVIITVAITAMSLGNLSVEQAQTALWMRPEHRPALTGNSVGLGLAVGSASALLAGYIVAVLGPEVVPVAAFDLLILGLVSVPLATAVIYVNNLVLLRADMTAANRGALLGAAAQCVPCILLAVLGRLSVAWVVLLWTTSTALHLLALLPALRAHGGRPSAALARRTVGIGARYHLGSASFHLLQRVDILLLNALAPTTAVGVYSLAVSLAELSYLLTNALAQAAMPRQLAAGDDEAAAFTARAVRLGTLLAGASVGVMCLTAPLLIPLVYGSAFGDGTGALLALAPGLLALGAVKPIGAYLLRLNRPSRRVATYGVALMLNVGLNLLLIPRYGIVGCAIASGAAYAALALMEAAWFLRAAGLSLNRLLPGRDELGRLRSVVGR